jgi:Ca-activated chloride channel family protein
MFTDPQWRGAASYRAGDFQKAIESLDGMQQPDALYNKGNALAKTGNLPQAIEAYNEALKLNPAHEDAKYNRDLLQRYLEQQQQQQQQQQKEQQQQNNNQSQNSGNNQQNSSSSQDQQSADQQAQDSDKEDQQQNAGSSSQQERKDQQHQQDEQQQASNRQSGQDQEQQQAQAKQQGQYQQDKNKDKDEEQTADTQAQLAQRNGDPQEDPQTRQRTEQWLRRIPDDPGGLLRRKFLYQSQLNQRQAQGETKPW